MQLKFLKINYEINNNKNNPMTSRTTKQPSPYLEWYAYHWLKSTVIEHKFKVHGMCTRGNCADKWISEWYTECKLMLPYKLKSVKGN
jgi:hypothetical protein